MSVEYEPFFTRASFTSKRSAKSDAASIRTLASIGSSAWLRTVSSSWKPLATRRRRMTVCFASTYTVPVPGTRKNRDSKYWRSSVDKAVRRWSSKVRTHRDRCRVSNENSPVGSVDDASISPLLFDTTKVFPLRICTWSVVTVYPPAAQPWGVDQMAQEKSAGSSEASPHHRSTSTRHAALPPSRAPRL